MNKLYFISSPAIHRRYAAHDVRAQPCHFPHGSPEAPLRAGNVSRLVEIPFARFTLHNGLTLIIHEDHKSPIVAVNVWYHVGSKNERPGRSGFAHLFEHLMFNGSEHFDDDYFQVMERIGATDLNGTTNNDRTNYFQNVPTSALDVALWMESDRMGHLLGAITQEKLDEQRGVVQNEKRQNENEPYGIVDELITHGTYPAGHPYSWTIIGSMDDLNAASLDDVHEWFKAYYGAANATLAIAGDIDTETVRQKVERYFGDIPSGPPISKHDVWIAKRSGIQRQQVQDRVPQPRLYKVWNIPQAGALEAHRLELVGDILGSGKTSRLHKRLVYDDQITTHVNVYLDEREIAGQFYIEATAKPGQDLTTVEQAIDEELQRFLDDGPTDSELQRVKTGFAAEFVRGIERMGGFGGVSDILAKNQVYFENPEFYNVTLRHMSEASVSDLCEVAREWLSDGVFTLEVHPFPQFKTSASVVDRTHLPPPEAPPHPRFPHMQRATLSNDITIVLVERHAVPIVDFAFLVDAGYASDQFATPGTARLAMAMLDEGTERRNALQISEELAQLGAELNTGSNLDMSSVTLSALGEHLDASLALYADIILHPSFPEADLRRLQNEQRAAIQREKVTPVHMALRVFPLLLYGNTHAYGNPLTGSGTEQSISRITRNDLIAFHTRWFRPNNATLIVVGATTMDEIRPKLETLFGMWQQGDVPAKNIEAVPHQTGSIAYIIDRPGSMQSLIFAGHVAPPKSNPHEVAIETLNNILGGMFTSRINMNLREDKHWSYGAQTLLYGARGQRPFICYASVQSDRTKESMIEMDRELRAISDSRPVTADELAKAQSNQILELPGAWETNRAIVGSVGDILRYGLPDNYFDAYPASVNALTLSDVTAAAREIIHPDQMVWVVVGDRSIVEAGVHELYPGNVHFIDSDGNLLA